MVLVYNKNLRWAVRVVSSKEYEAALRKSQELQRERRRLDKQRSIIRKCLVSHAARVSGVIHGAVALNSGDEDPERQRALTDELLRVKEELRAALEELKNSNAKTDFLTNRLERAEKTAETLSESAQKARLREELLRKENEQLITENDNLTQTIEEQASELLDFEKKMAALQSRISAFDREMAEKDALVAKAELSAKYLRESTRVVRTASETLEPIVVEEAEITALLDKMASLELEASACRSAHVTLYEQLASAKSETAGLAQELIEQTQREEEMRTTIDVLTDQLNTALRTLGTGCSSPQASATKDSSSADDERGQHSQIPQRPLRRHSTAEAVLQARGAALRMRYGSWDIAAPPPADDIGANDILVAQLNSSRESYAGVSATPFERNS
jgi:DNA repair exonuclease SbcCD ATPase subunit